MRIPSHRDTPRAEETRPVLRIEAQGKVRGCGWSSGRQADGKHLYI